MGGRMTWTRPSGMAGNVHGPRTLSWAATAARLPDLWGEGRVWAGGTQAGSGDQGPHGSRRCPKSAELSLGLGPHAEHPWPVVRQHCSPEALCPGPPMAERHPPSLGEQHPGYPAPTPTPHVAPRFQPSPDDSPRAFFRLGRRLLSPFQMSHLQISSSLRGPPGCLPGAGSEAPTAWLEAGGSP